ncbi:MAG TPA: Na+/H+ antiporter subunit D [Acidimicrobiales bacterium]|nr:Na+/H+ antiporter subunit D [Acidimicrobiales bacterium]
MRALVPLVVVVPLLGAAAALVASRYRAVQRVISVLTVVATTGIGIAILVGVEADGIAAVQLGGWEAPLGITLAVDLMAGMFLVVSLLTVLAVLVFAIGQASDRRAVFHPSYLVLTAGVSLSFISGDLFNLFVAFEMMLIASYVLITLGATREQVRAGMTYVVINLTASTLFIAACAWVYAATGTLNFADLATIFPGLPDAVRLSLGLVFLVVFGVKAAIFPLFGWLPDSYPTAPTSITAVFAGLLTKVGVYAIIRTQTIFGLEELGPLILLIAGVTMIVGVLGAIAQDDVKRILSFHIISQIGYMIMGLGLWSVAGLAGAVIYVVHQIPVKTVLFLVGGLIEHTTGTGTLRRIGGMLRRAPLIAVLFLLPALSLAGVPPFSGFVAKLALVDAGLGGEAWAIVAVSLVASVLTLVSMTKIWAGVFWGEPDEAPPIAASMAPDAHLRAPALMTGATIGAVALTLAIAVAAGPLFDLAERAAVDLVDTAAYVEAVTGTVAP